MDKRPRRLQERMHEEDIGGRWRRRCRESYRPPQVTERGRHVGRRQTTSKFPFRWWGVNSTLFGKHQLEGLPEPHSGRQKLLTGKSYSMQSYGVRWVDKVGFIPHWQKENYDAVCGGHIIAP
jgi:hypothetical protein